MQAFHGDEKLKSDLLAEVEKHRIADQIIGGTYGDEDDNGKWQGCAVGCSIRSYNLMHGDKEAEDTNDHSAYPRLFGIPQILAKLEDRIFEGLPDEDKPAWPGQFFNAIRPGADLTTVWPKFAIWLLVDADHGVIRHATSDASKTAIERVAELYRTNGTKKQFLEARKQARSAAYAGYAYADAVADAADAVADAAVEVANAYADASFSDWKTERGKHFKAQSEQLLKLLAEA